jgi:hypothetical protein
MLKKIVTLIFVAAMVLSISSAMADDKNTPIQLSLISPIQLFPESYSVTGVRLSLIYGRNTSVTGLDWGLVNHTTSGQSTGIQWGIVGLSDANFMGWQDNFVNVVKGDFQGFQSGFVNHANYANGLQFGVVNYARKLKGIQIGLVNIIKQGGQFPVFPIVNWSF